MNFDMAVFASCISTGGDASGGGREAHYHQALEEMSTNCIGPFGLTATGKRGDTACSAQEENRLAPVFGRGRFAGG